MHSSHSSTRPRPRAVASFRRVRPIAMAAALTASVVLVGDPAAGAAADRPHGFLAARTDTLYSHERRLMGAIDPVLARELFTRLASTPRVAGTAGAAAAADWLAARLEGWGWQVERRSYRVYLPHAAEVSVERLAPSLQRLGGSAAGDPPDGYPAATGYSAAGDVTGRVVYANRGSREDFAHLAAAGVDVTGAVVLMRYGDGFRGAKVLAAQGAGAAAVLLFSDPADDGFTRGPVFPAGPFRPENAIERGSVKVAAPGDPSTPGWPSRPGAVRVAPEDPRAGLPSIPAVAVGYGAAQRLLEEMEGSPAPAAWQGGLRVVYRAGGSDAVRARVRVTSDQRPFKTVTNVLARWRGRSRPEETVVAGAHYDSWTEGAVDNVSGTVSLLLVARAVARLGQFGMFPSRSLVLGFWDAEEWGLVGSTEHVEDHRAALAAGAVAYLNQDGIAGGPLFAASASPSLARLLREVTRVVDDPLVPGASVYDEWIRRAAATGGASLTPPGAGSDDAPFFALGIPTLSFGFHGASGVYHSDHDGAEFMLRFGDPDFAQHVAAARVAALAAWRLADADLLPLDYGDYGRVLLEHARRLPVTGAAAAERDRLEAALREFVAAAGRLERAAGEAMAPPTATPVRPLLERADRHLMAVERTLTRPQGLPGRPWQRNVVWAPDAADAYRVIAFPGVEAALAGGDPAHLRAEIRDLAARVDRARGELATAAALVAPGGPGRAAAGGRP